MDRENKAAMLQRLLDLSEGITVQSSTDPDFKSWKNTVERTLVRIFGAESPEFKQFDRLQFFYNPVISVLGADHSQEHRRCFERDWKILISSIRSYIEELDEDDATGGEATSEEAMNKALADKVFVSHSSGDACFAEEIVDLLEVMGLPAEKIFCTSLAGYGVDLGENFLDTIRDQLFYEVLVLFVLTKNFFQSPVCLCEMGAAWVLTREHIPILVPPFEFSEIDGVIPLTEGIRINEPLKLNLLKQKVESLFGIGPVLKQSA